ncbi:helix-turn-helix transcriptional regulator [Nocardioides sp.]|uniref:helix-turn-helix transcriptional regulator n=1 Tax=Nocardioides sp. TaxID=35761 RepID=UPI0039E46D78
MALDDEGRRRAAATKRERTLERIDDAVERLLDNGVAPYDLNMRQVAREAEVSPATLYRYYDDMPTLLQRARDKPSIARRIGEYLGLLEDRSTGREDPEQMSLRTVDSDDLGLAIFRYDEGRNGDQVTLSAREVRLLLLLAEGWSTDRVAEEMQISAGTARSILRMIREKMREEPRTEHDEGLDLAGLDQVE